MLNIRGLNKDIDMDSYYRYKMHKPTITNGKNNKIFDNIDIIAKDIDREPKNIIKYLKSKNGVNINYKNNCAVLPKNFDNQLLINSIYEFIEHNVICGNCKLPETKIVNENIVCNCCSYSRKL